MHRCTGLGALRRRPDARWRPTRRRWRVAAAATCPAAHCRASTRVGGVVAYATCSPHSRRPLRSCGRSPKAGRRRDRRRTDAAPGRLGPGTLGRLSSFATPTRTDAMFVAVSGTLSRAFGVPESSAERRKLNFATGETASADLTGKGRQMQIAPSICPPLCPACG